MGLFFGIFWTSDFAIGQFHTLHFSICQQKNSGNNIEKHYLEFCLAKAEKWRFSLGNSSYHLCQKMDWEFWAWSQLTLWTPICVQIWKRIANLSQKLSRIFLKNDNENLQSVKFPNGLITGSENSSKYACCQGLNSRPASEIQWFYPLHHKGAESIDDLTFSPFSYWASTRLKIFNMWKGKKFFR